MIASAISPISPRAIIGVVSTARAPLFVRLSEPLLTELDARIEVDGRTKQAVVEDLLARQLRTPATQGDGDMVDLATLAAILQIDERDVLDRIATGDFPARRFGNEWRFSRSAVTAWLHGTDPITDRTTGFVPG